MKLFPVILGISLFINALLLPICVYRQTTESTKSASVTEASGLAVSSQTRSKANFDAADHALVEQLRAEGFSPEAIRVIIRDTLNKQYAERRKALLSPAKPFWDADFNIYRDNYPFNDPKGRAAWRELDKEYDETLNALLGNEGKASFESDNEKRIRFMSYGNLPEAKIAQIETVSEDYGAMRDEIYGAMKGIRFPDDEDQLALLEKEERADIAKILTPDELYQYDLRSSDIAFYLQQKIRNFIASEEEYKNLYTVEEAFDEQYGKTSLTSVQKRMLREEMTKAVLTPERFAEYVVVTADSYGFVKNSIETHYNLPEGTTAFVINTERDISARADAIRRDASLSTTERENHLAALSQEVRNKLLPALGEEPYTFYTRSEGEGDWIQKLTAKIPGK